MELARLELRTELVGESSASLPPVLMRNRFGCCESLAPASVILTVNSGQANGAWNAISRGEIRSIRVSSRGPVTGDLAQFHPGEMVVSVVEALTTSWKILKPTS